MANVDVCVFDDVNKRKIVLLGKQLLTAPNFNSLTCSRAFDHVTIVVPLWMFSLSVSIEHFQRLSCSLKVELVFLDLRLPSGVKWSARFM